MQNRYATFISQDRKLCVKGFWAHRGGSLWLGEITILTATTIFRFSSTSPTDNAGLAGYATPEYLARFADRFQPRKDGYLV